MEAAGGPAARTIAEGGDWSVGEFVCTAGPGDRGFEERHDRFSFAAVVEGTFRYRGERGASLLYPGALLLGNHGACFECGHEHGRGDRCIAVQVETPLFEEIAAGAAGTARFRFPAGMLPASAASVPWLARLQAAARPAARPIAEEAVIALAERVVAAVAAVPASAPRLSARDERRIGEVMRHIEATADGPVDLDRLARLAGMSKYHFLRTFRRVAGRTPYQFVLDLRLRAAAVRVATSDEPIARIAFEAGFGDLSTFNARFRHVFGASPRSYRAGRRG